MMTFYEMMTIAGVGVESQLKQILQEEKWADYWELYLYNSGIKTIPETLTKRYHQPVPEELAIAVASLSKWRFMREGQLLFSLGEAPASPDSLNALEAYGQFGGRVLERAIERGTTEIVST